MDSLELRLFYELFLLRSGIDTLDLKAVKPTGLLSFCIDPDSLFESLDTKFCLPTLVSSCIVLFFFVCRVLERFRLSGLLVLAYADS